MGDKANHISVCVCTYKRPEFLRRLLRALGQQKSDGLFTYSIIVADNDQARSAEGVVREFVAGADIHVKYCVEPRQNIALARNKAVENAVGDFIAFIDDDEFPTENWLGNLFRTCVAYGVAGVLGPVEPYFAFDPPRWVKSGGFFQRPRYTTGRLLAWHETRTGNVLFERNIVSSREAPFRPEFAVAGEDMDFFRRMMEKGCEFVWCDEAVVYEEVPLARCSRSYLLRSALLRGSNFRKHPANRIRNAVKSLIAVPCYAMALPFLAFFGQHVALKYTIKICDHGSRLLALMGWRLMTHRNRLA
jgi:succinoglycan biosynthesis protein ExoM